MNVNLTNLHRNTKMTLAGITGALMMSSCLTDLLEKEKAKTLPYLTANELLEAEKSAQTVSTEPLGSMADESIAYWSDILTKFQMKDAYYDGKKYAVDMYKGLDAKKKEYPLNLKSDYLVGRSSGIIAKELKESVAKYTSAVEYDKLRKEEPAGSLFATSRAQALKFWSDIYKTFQLRDAFDKGVKEANDSINKRKISTLNGLDKSM